MTEPQTSVFSNRPYQIALTIAVLLFLAMVTVAALIIILANAREEDRESEFNVTLTAAYADLSRLQTAAVLSTPTPAPVITPGTYAFALAEGAPEYLGTLSCDTQFVTGQVRNQDGEPRDDLAVMVWGDYLLAQIVSTGEIAGLEPGYWSVRLNGTANRRIWVQLATAGRHFSAPVEIVFAAGDCQRNQVRVDFEQVAPLAE